MESSQGDRHTAGDKRPRPDIEAMLSATAAKKQNLEAIAEEDEEDRLTRGSGSEGEEEGEDDAEDSDAEDEISDGVQSPESDTDPDDYCDESHSGDDTDSTPYSPTEFLNEDTTPAPPGSPHTPAPSQEEGNCASALQTLRESPVNSVHSPPLRNAATSLRPPGV